jgi:hypothetical protein
MSRSVIIQNRDLINEFFFLFGLTCQLLMCTYFLLDVTPLIFKSEPYKLDLTIKINLDDVG